MRNLAVRYTLIALLSAAVALAQTSSGQIAVTVFDPSGAIVPGATVTITGSDTGELVRTLTTDDAGSAIAPLLRPGAYTVIASAQGFKRLERSGITLRVDDALSARATVPSPPMATAACRTPSFSTARAIKTISAASTIAPATPCALRSKPSPNLKFRPQTSPLSMELPPARS